VHDQLAKALKVPEVLQPHHGTRLLVITHETIGRRWQAWHSCLGTRLRAIEQYAVTLAAPGRPDRNHPGVCLVGYDAKDPYYRDLQPYIISTDVILAMAPLFARIPGLQDLGKPAIVDLYDPFELEKLAQSAAIDPRFHEQIDAESANELELASSLGDFFICASERQRDFWLGVLLDSGRP